MNNFEQPNMGENQADDSTIFSPNPSEANGQTQYSRPSAQTSGQVQYVQPQYQFQPQYAQPGTTFGQPPIQPQYAQPYYPPAPSSNHSPLMDFLTFRLMVTPIIIQVIFWLGIIVIVISALAQFSSPYYGNPLAGLLILIIGPLLWRVLCELYILLFRIHDSLNDIKSDLRQRR